MNQSEIHVPFNDISRRINTLPDLKSQIESLVIKGPYLNGAYTENFEDSFSDYIGTKYALGVSSGTTALELCIKALHLDRGSTILLAANAGGYGSIAIQKSSLISKYIDVDQDGLLDTQKILGNLDGVKAIIVTHLYGQMAPILTFFDELRNRGIYLIEDCAQATGALVENRRAGSIGDISAFSFYPTKNIGAIGDAGAICTSNELLFNRAKLLREYGWSNRYYSELSGGGNNRIDEIQALVVDRQLSLLDGWNDKRRTIWCKYADSLSGKSVRLLGSNSNTFVAHLAVLVVQNRPQFIKYMRSLGIDTSIHYPFPDYIQNGLYSGKNQFNLPQTEKLCNSVISVPIFPEMTDFEIEWVAQALIDYKG